LEVSDDFCGQTAALGSVAYLPPHCWRGWATCRLPSSWPHIGCLPGRHGWRRGWRRIRWSCDWVGHFGRSSTGL